MNWTELIEDLVKDGMTQEQIAAKCGTSQSNISYLLNSPDRSPSWSLGQRLVNLHDAQIGKKSS